MRALDRRELKAVARERVGEAGELWRSSLSRDGGSSPALLSLLRDWSEYSTIDYETMLASMLQAQEKVDREWEEQARETAEAVAEFYDQTDTIIPLLVWWHGTTTGPARCAAAADGVFGRAGAKRVLDFGSGIGSTALVLARGGREVVLSEIASDPLKFSEWRMKLRGFAPQTLDLRTQPLETLEPGSIDGIVSFDVFEHLPDPKPTLETLDSLLASTGAMVFNQVFIPKGDVEEHYPRRGEILMWLHDHNYRLAHITDICWIAQKASLLPAQRLFQLSELRTRIAAAKAVDGRGGRAGRFAAYHGLRYTVR